MRILTGLATLGLVGLGSLFYLTTNASFAARPDPVGAACSASCLFAAPLPAGDNGLCLSAAGDDVQHRLCRGDPKRMRALLGEGTVGGAP